MTAAAHPIQAGRGGGGSGTRTPLPSGHRVWALPEGCYQRKSDRLGAKVAGLLGHHFQRTRDEIE